MKHSNELENSTCPKCGSTNVELNISTSKIVFTAKIILVIFVCIGIVLVAYGSTRNLEDSSIGIFIGIGAAFVALSVGIAVFIFVKESKSTAQVICKDCGEKWSQKK